MPAAVPAYLRSVVLLLGALRAIAYSNYYVEDSQHGKGCEKKLVGKIMCCDVKESTDRTVTFKRGDKKLKCGDKYVKGEKLTVSLSDTMGMFVLEASAGTKFKQGSCGGVRVTQSSTDLDNNFPLTAPSDGSALHVTYGWSTGFGGGVKVAACQLKCCGEAGAEPEKPACRRRSCRRRKTTTTTTPQPTGRRRSPRRRTGGRRRTPKPSRRRSRRRRRRRRRKAAAETAPAPQEAAAAAETTPAPQKAAAADETKPLPQKAAAAAETTPAPQE